MPRIVGIDLPKDKRIVIALTYIHGVGRTSSIKILATANIDQSTRAKELTEEEISRIAAILQKDYRVEGDLRREVSQNIKRMMEIGAYRGLRHKRSLPARGQRTRTNSRTRKGPRRGSVSGKK